MKLVKTLFGVLFATVLLATTAVASDLKGPAFDSSKLFGLGTSNVENWILSLGGSGATTTTGDSQSAFGVNLQLGHVDTIFIPGEVGIRQNINWASTPNQNAGTWGFSTAVYQDWKLLTYKSFNLYAGGNVAALYGNRTLAWTLGPELEARLWLKKDVYTFFRTEYNFDISDSGLKCQDALRYVLGVGFKF
jgi:hypothetical protein